MAQAASSVVYEGLKITVPRVSAFSYCFPAGLDAKDNSPAFIDASTDTQLTRGEVKDKALKLAYSLRTLSSLSHGEDLTENSSFLIFSPNHLLYPIVTLASLASGVPIACASAASVPKDLVHCIDVTKASFYVVHPALLPVFVQAMELRGVGPSDYVKRTVVLFSTPDTPKEYGTVSELIESGKLSSPMSFDGEKAKTSNIWFFSSGTTGLPKAVEISHFNIVAQSVSAHRMDMFRKSESCIMSTPFPFFHVAAGIHCAFYPLSDAIPVVIWSAIGFNMEAYLGGLAKYKVSATAVAPPIVAALVVHPAVATTNLSRLERMISGAAPVPPHLLKKCSDRLKPLASQNFALCPAFGMSETCSMISMSMTAIETGKLETVGTLNPGVSARIVDIEKGCDVKAGEIGELWLKGDCIMNGYLGNSRATVETMTNDGWLQSGDVGRIDEDGYIYILDRLKEMIKYNGFQVPPAELEAVLAAHPAIADAGVIGVLAPDGFTELPKHVSYTITSDFDSTNQLKSTTLPNEIAEWVSARVARHKQLRGGIVLVKTIPRSPAGKILRKDLRALDKQPTASSKSNNSPLAKL
ncbi:AMP binding protein [Clavulina sp. PMI_390]|nr:AMP binding protein [Clavulina sp. PMI_390]